MEFSIGIVIFSFLLISSCSSQELKLSQVVHRHGQRSPVQFYPNDPHKNFWTDGPGQLTNVGKMEAYRLGQFLRKRYVINDNFLNKTFKHSYIHVRSSDEDRTLESAELVLAGLYPPYEENIWNKNLLWEPIAVHTVPKVNDYLLQYSGTDCPRFSSEFQKAAKVDPLKSFAEKYQSLYTYLSSKSGMEIDATNSWIIYDNMFNELLHKLEPPYWALKKMKELTEENAEKYGLYVPNNILQRIKGGPLVKEIILNFDKHVNQSSSVKFYQFSGHDSTLAVLMSTLKIFNELQPPYSSALIFELFKIKSVNISDSEDSHSVKISFKNDSSVDPFVLTLPGCTQLCSLKTFKTLIKDMIPEDIARECGLTNSNSDIRPKFLLITFFIIFFKMILI